jgi:hypothetical protein
MLLGAMMKMTRLKVVVPVLMAVGAGVTAAPLPDVRLDQLRVFDNLPPGLWIIETGSVPENPLFPRRHEQICASASDIRNYLAGGIIPGSGGERAGAKASCENGRTRIVTNFLGSARVEMICPGRTIQGVTIPDARIEVDFERRSGIIMVDSEPVLTATAAGDDVSFYTKASYINRTCS